MHRRGFMACLGGGAAGVLTTSSATANRASPDQPIVSTYVANVLVDGSLPKSGEHVSVRCGEARSYDQFGLCVADASGRLLGNIPPIHGRVLGPLIAAGYQAKGWVEASKSGTRPSLRIALAIVPPEVNGV